MSEKWFYSIIHRCLRLYVSLQKWHSTLEHLSLHLKPRARRFLFSCCTCSPKKRNQVSRRSIFFFSERSTIRSQVGNIVPSTSANSEISRLSAFELDNHVCQHMAPGVTRWITKDSDCCRAGSLTGRSGRTATAVVGDRWASRRKIEGGQVWTVAPSKGGWADSKTQT